MKTKCRISGYILRSGLATLFVAFVIVALSSAITLPNHHSTFPSQQSDIAFGMNGHESAASLAASVIQKNRTLTFSDRVAYQRAIEEVYWRHRIWPKENTSPKPPLDKVMTQAEIEKKVEDYLRDSQALEDYWQRPITPDQLQAEIERIASHTKQPEVLREIFAALGNDPFVIAECLARPILAEHLLTELYAHDQRFHGELKRCAEAELRTHPSVSQMKQTSGRYTEMEWIKSESTPDQAAGGSAPNALGDDGKANHQRCGAERGITLNSREWQEGVEKLAKDLGNTRPGNGWAQIRTDVLSPLREDEGHYYAVAVSKKGKGRLKLATVAWLKEPLRSWLAKAETQVPVTIAAVSANYARPVISAVSDNASPSVSCTDNTWTFTSLTNAPAARAGHTAVWTGSEMIVWGGYGNAGYLNTGGRYNPTTDSWITTSATPAPSARASHTAVWTGREMIVWGGYYSDAMYDYYLNTGGRYNPTNDTWTATLITPLDGRVSHTAVWTGREMIVWGGYRFDLFNGAQYLNTGGRYNPATATPPPVMAKNGAEPLMAREQLIKHFPNTPADSWTATDTTGAPSNRASHTAVWTGSEMGEMIVWGGADMVDRLGDGGRYNPTTDSWTRTSRNGAPADRSDHTAVWTGTEMIVWGGSGDSTPFLNTGGKYNPSLDSWTATSLTNAPAARYYHSAVWTGSEMIIWGGNNGTLLNTGGRYNPGTATPPPIAPKNSVEPLTAGDQLIEQIPDTPDSIWTATNLAGAPAGRDFHTAVWTGSEMIVWGGEGGGYTGSKYCAATPTPTQTPTPTPTPTPAVTTNPATNVASFSGTLNGSVNPRGSTTTVYFQYGLTTSYGSNTPMQTRTGNAVQAISANISGLSASTTYHFRIVAHNAGGTTYGSDRTFSTLSATGPPVVITKPASYIASFSARLNGSVDPHGLTTTVYFQYGTTTSYGHTTANQNKTGNAYQSVSANIGGLTASTTYHFRIVATNSSGTRYGSDRTFTTLSATGPPVVITNPATNVASSSATLNGSVDPHGLTTNVHFQYGTTASYGNTTANQSKTGNAYQNVAANVSGLAAHTRYHFRIVATNSAGTRYGSDRTFTTP